TGAEKTVPVTKGEDGNWTAPAGSEVEVDPKTGAVTIPADKVKDGSTVSAVSKDEAGNTSSPSTDTAKKDPTTADKTEPNKPAVTEVTDPANLTDAEKEKVKEKVKEANPDLPTGTTVEVGNDGTVTIKYPDGSEDKIPGSGTVVPAPQTEAEKNDLTNPTKTSVADTNNLTEDEKAKVKEEVEKANPSLPEGTKVEVGNDGTVTVKYPDGSTDTIPGTDTVVSTTPTPQTEAEKNDVTNPTKTPVADTNNLTEDEKAKVKEEVEKANPSLPEGTKVEVGNDGTVTVKYPDGSTDTIPGIDTVVSTTPTPQTEAEKNDVTNPTKTPVADANNLTEDEKAKVKEEVEKANPDLPKDTQVEVGKDGTVTIKYPDGSTDTIPGKDTVTTDGNTTPTPQTDAEKNSVTNPTKTPVADTNNLTEDEKAKVKDAVEKANPSLPEGTTVEVDKDGTVTITYPDKSTDTIPGKDTVVSTTPTPQTDAEKNDVTNPTKTPVADPTNLTDAEKAKVKEEVEKANPDLPKDTQVEVGKDGTVTIKYPDGSTDTIPGTDTVVSTAPTPQTEAEKNGITNPSATPVKDLANLTDVEKARVKAEVEKANPNLPTDAKIKVGNDGTVTITYSDNSTDTIPSSVTVFYTKHGDGASQILPGYDLNADDDKDGFTNGEELNKGSNPNDPNSIPSDSTKPTNPNTIPSDSTAPEAPVVNTPTAGDKTVSGKAEPGSTVTVTFPDGSKVTTVTDEHGNFVVSVPTGVVLKAGDIISATATDRSGNTSKATEVKVIANNTNGINADTNGQSGNNSSANASGSVVTNTNVANLPKVADQQKAKEVKQAVLPNTGEASSSMSVLGLLALSTVGLVAMKRRRKEEE
ncbi:TPA: Ig-like domain-containing protein, partial [Streptococcus suis]